MRKSPTLKIHIFVIYLMYVVIILKVFYIPLNLPSKGPKEMKNPIEISTITKGFWCKAPNSSFEFPTYHQEKVDPATYKGYIHPSWPPNKSLKMEDYLDRNDYVNMDINDCQKNGDNWKARIRIFMMLHSDPRRGGEATRNDNRNTWMTFLQVLLTIVSSCQALEQWLRPWNE